jgi:hypothetical protein
MRRHLGILGFGTILAGLLAGCSSKPVLREKQPQDPLLISKKPVEGKQSINAAPGGADECAPPPRPIDPARPVYYRR